MNQKPIVVMDLSTSGKGGGPYTSSVRIMESELKEKYEFKVIDYKTEIGRGISLKRILDLKKQIEKLKPDIVHFAGLQLTGFHVAIACRLAGIKRTIITIHGFSGDALYFHPVKKFITKYIIEPITLLLVKKICGVSEYVVTRRVVRLFKKKCAGVVYNFPPPKVLNNEQFDIRKELGIGSTDRVVVTVARITKDKGYHIYEKVISKFQNVENLKFIVVGNGDYLPEMKKNLQLQVGQNQVFFLGYRGDVQQIHKGCDIFALPTLHETLSIALLEASMENLPLIASNTGGIPEIVKTDYNGILVSTGDIDAMYNAINKLYQDKELCLEYGNNARKRLDEKFSDKSIVQKLDGVYQSVLKG